MKQPEVGQLSKEERSEQLGQTGSYDTLAARYTGTFLHGKRVGYGDKEAGEGSTCRTPSARDAPSSARAQNGRAGTHRPSVNFILPYSSLPSQL